jgi:hypothetical protein
MATLYSDLFPTRTSDIIGLQSRQEGYKTTPRYSFTNIDYTFVGTEAADDVVRLWKFPKGTIIIPQFSGLWTLVDAATTLTVDIGDLDTLTPSPLVASDADRYADGVDCGAVGYDSFGTAGVAYAAPYKLLEDCYVTMTFATLATPVAGGLIRVGIAYLGP